MIEVCIVKLKDLTVRLAVRPVVEPRGKQPDLTMVLNGYV
jgi:hypothetical protein